MTDRIAEIRHAAKEHASRGVYDNACAKTGIERNAYAEAWSLASLA